MTRKVLLFAFVLSCCLVADAGQFSTPVIEAPNLSSFLASLALEPTLRSETTDSYCQVTLNCQAVPEYGSIACESYNSDCHAGYEWVECDGVRKDCPVCVQRCCGEVRCFGWSSCTSTFGPPVVLYCDGVNEGACIARHECGW